METGGSSVRNKILLCLPLEMQNDAQLLEYLIRVVESLHVTPLTISVVKKSLNLVMRAAGLSESNGEVLWEIND